MADYYPLLSKAVAGLEPNTADTRQGIYERARSALTRQLASMDPPVAQDILDREIGALEAVFVRIESDQRAARAQAAPTAAATTGVVADKNTAEIVSPQSAAPNQTRPQVLPVKTKQNRKPLIAVGLSLGMIAVVAIATLAFLRRNEPAAVANRPAPVITTQPITGQPNTGQANRAQPNPASVAERPPTPAKTNDRVLPSAGDTPAVAVPAPQAPATPAPAVIPPAPTVATRPAVAPPVIPPNPVPLTTAPPPVASTPPAIAVANKALMILEGKEQPTAIEQRPGTVVWRTDMVSGGQGQPLQQTIKASVDIPEARTRAEVIIQRNRDAAFPASHTIQVQFSSVGASELGAVQSLSLLELRQSENQGGYPVAGQGIAVMENVFLIALTKVEPSMARNIEMMLSRPFLYFEFQFVGGRRGAIVIDKGISGQQAFDDAFRNWQ